MSSASDSGMFKTMGLVMAALGLFAIVCGVAARILSSGAGDPADVLMRSALIERIEPVAQVRTSAEQLPVAAEAEAAMDVAGVPKTGEELVNGACSACHAAGVAGAPLLNDDAAWSARRAAGLDALVATVINGKGSMPARGGSTYSDEEIRLAVQYIAMFEPEVTAAVQPEAAAEEATATTDAVTGVATETASEEAGASDAALATASAEAMLVVGQIPDGLTDNIKASVDGICSGCHISGVAGAPKIGDTAAWQVRADKGLTALTNSVINGMNAMPARGGSGLSDEEIPVAIQYLMSK